MDVDRFDAFVRTFGARSARRGVIAGLIGGGLASLVTMAESDAGRRANRQAGLSAEKRKHKKNKKKKRRDKAPSCAANSCPLPPGCSGQVVEDCAAALRAEIIADAEHCRTLCEGGDSPACRDCLQPVVLARQPDVAACALESCSSAERLRDGARDGRAGARAWWVRQCDKPCCYRELQGCKEDAAEAYVLCLVGAVASCFTPAAPLCALAIEGCFAMAAYQITKCNARYGCPEFDGCKPDNTCCLTGEHACDTNICCSHVSQCCAGGGCCRKEDVCCRTTEGVHYCCSGRDGLTCKPSAGNTCMKA
jgi:hypothetical protein